MSEVVSRFALESITSVAKRNLCIILSFSSRHSVRHSASVKVQIAVKHVANLSASREGESKGCARPNSPESKRLRSDGTWVTLRTESTR